MKYTKEELKKIQKIELDILLELKRICEKHNLTYFSIGGTTLGAIRHNGFIPWDDDIDIGMLRGDYEKFLRIAPKELKKGYTLQHFYTDENCPTYHAKIRKDKTVFKETAMQDLPIHHGVFLDIMPYDKIPENKIKQVVYLTSVFVLRQLYISKLISVTTYTKDPVRIVFGNYVRKTLNFLLKPMSRKKIFNFLQRVITYYNDSNSNFVTIKGLDVFISRLDDLLPVKNHIFEYIEIPIPVNYDKVLRTQYGDYMKLPPEEKRYTHKPCCLKLDGE